MAKVIVTGYVVATTGKAVLLELDDDGREIWYPRNQCAVMGGYPKKGEWLSLSVPQWLYDKANGEQSAPPPATQGRAGVAVPPDMLKRLIQLCHPDKHNGSKASTTATEWLLQQRVRG